MRPPTATTLARVSAQLAEIQAGDGDGTVRVGGAEIRVSSLGKVWFPDDGITKGDVLRYYVAVARAMLPLLADRPLVLRRFPSGITGASFHQHNAGSPPAGVRAETVPGVSDDETRFIGGDLGTLLHTVQLGALSVHCWNARITAPYDADWITLDLDPGPKSPFARAVTVAHRVREQLTNEGLTSFCKTSGSRGLHLLAPLPPNTSADEARAIAVRVADATAAACLGEATTARAIRDRAPDAIYVDALQNAPGKTVAAAWSVRARPGATISAPLQWSEVTDALDPRAFTIRTLEDRLAVARGWGRGLRSGSR